MPLEATSSLLILAGPRVESRLLEAAEHTPHPGVAVSPWRRLTWPHWQVAEATIDLPCDQLRARLMSLSGNEVEVLAVPSSVRSSRRRLIVSDVDSTLITSEVIELLAKHAGSRDEVARITESAMRGELDFSQSLRERVRTLAGLPVTVFSETMADIRFSPGAEELVRTVLARGDVFALVSGGFLEIVHPLASPLGIRQIRANLLEVHEGRLTGRVSGPIIDRAAKARALLEFAKEAGVAIADTVAVGDGANDLDMIDAAGLGIAYNAKPIVEAQASVALRHGRLDVVLDILGMRPGASVTVGSEIS